MATFRKIIISTSTLSSNALDNGGFGPVNDECYAVGYGIRSEGCRAQVKWHLVDQLHEKYACAAA